MYSYDVATSRTRFADGLFSPCRFVSVVSTALLLAAILYTGPDNAGARPPLILPSLTPATIQLQYWAPDPKLRRRWRPW